jgi:molybdopterin-guanine dinucleotide biosynthesis protein A
MGRAKAWLPWFGQTLVEHVVARLAEVVDEIVVVCSDALELPRLEARVVHDLEPGRGPLVGLREGLGAIEADFAFVTSTDTPFLEAEYVRALLERGQPCAPEAEGHVQVLSAVYPRSAHGLADRLLAEGRARPLDLLERLGFERVAAAALPTGRSGFAPWHGFNTPKAYLEAVRAVDPDAQAEAELLGRAALAAECARRSVPVGTLAEVLSVWPAALGLVDGDRVARSHLVSLGGRELVRDLALPVGPGERVSVIDALAGG